MYNYYWQWFWVYPWDSKTVAQFLWMGTMEICSNSEYWITWKAYGIKLGCTETANGKYYPVGQIRKILWNLKKKCINSLPSWSSSECDRWKMERYRSLPSAGIRHSTFQWIKTTDWKCHTENADKTAEKTWSRRNYQSPCLCRSSTKGWIQPDRKRWNSTSYSYWIERMGNAFVEFVEKTTLTAMSQRKYKSGFWQ